jgi:demethylmenaquinone methyltransferase / 2-methoxy-6-polyprenyl-1,4-benzoquinol methylase
MNTSEQAPAQEPDDHYADFGYQQVPRGEKKARVRGVFDSVAERYDLMNDVMSFGLHRYWKAFTVARTGLKPGQRALDVAAGSGDLSAGLARRVGQAGTVVVSDVNAAMLARGRDRLIDDGFAGNIHYVQADAEQLPFPSAAFHCVTIGFGLRNVTDKNAALASMYRVLKPGGRLLVLEFSTPKVPAIAPVYDLYSFHVLPRLGPLLVGDADSYRYLAESIRMHPDQETLRGMMEATGFERCEVYNLCGGIVALHVGFRI